MRPPTGLTQGPSREQPLGHLTHSLHACMRAPPLLQGSIDSQANGALMRATPLAVWGRGLSDEALARAAAADALLSHPNQVAWGCSGSTRTGRIGSASTGCGSNGKEAW